MTEDVLDNSNGVPATRRRRDVVARTLIVVTSVAVLVASVVAYGLSAYWFGKRDTVTITEPTVTPGTDWDHDGTPDPLPAKAAFGATTFLLVGSDSREGLTREERNEFNLGHEAYGERTDTIIVGHMSQRSGHVTLVSIPRDLLVTIPEFTDGDGQQRGPFKSKVNAAYAYGGPSLLMETVSRFTGMDIEHYIQVDVAGFAEIVDTLGGVPVCLDRDVDDRNSGLELSAGRHVLDGQQAVAYVRARNIETAEGSGELGRVHRQQTFLASVVREATGSGVLTNPSQLNRLLVNVMESVTTDDELSRQRAFDLAWAMQDLDPENVTFTTVPVTTGGNEDLGYGWVWLWDEEEVGDLFTTIREDERLAPEPTETATDGEPGDEPTDGATDEPTDDPTVAPDDPTSPTPRTAAETTC